MKNLSLFLVFLMAAISCNTSIAFVTPTSKSTPFIKNHNKITAPSTFVQNQGSTYFSQHQPNVVRRQRVSAASVATMSLFGLGGPEIAVILIAGAFLLGPQKLAELSKDAGKIAGELKEVPAEFQKGLTEGEEEAKKFKKEITGEKAPVKDVESKATE